MGKKFLNKIILLTGFLIGAPFAVLASDIPQLGFTVDGRTRLVVTDPSGNKTGSHGSDYFTESSRAQLNLYKQGQDIEYTDAELGTYDLDFRGQYNEQFTLSVRVIHNGQYNEQDFVLWAHALENSVVSFTLSENTDGQLQMTSEQLNKPIGQAVKVADQVHLQWGVVPNASSYTVFYKYHDYPYYTELDTTTETSAQTNINWSTNTASGEPIDLYYFRIQAHLPHEQVTVLSDIISNDDQDQDRYSDYRESLLGTDPNNADTDGDGLEDFSEVNQYYTNPLVRDTDGDSFSDGDEVAAGTLANNADSYPGRIPDCDAPATDTWNITTDCDVQSDQTVPGDIVVHPNALMRIHKDITVWFDYYAHKILVMFGAGIQLDPGARIQQK